MDKFLTCSVGENNVEIKLSKGNPSNVAYDELFLLNNGINYKKKVELFGDLDTYKRILSGWFKKSSKIWKN